MNRQWSLERLNYFFAIIIFLIISFFLTYNVLNLPSLVIGDNLHWTTPNVIDMLGLKVIRESFLGDVALISTFKIGFLFPLVYTISVLNLPVTLVYPFFFYFLCMLSFYTLSTEFLCSKALCIIISTMYVINPVTPYYFASIFSAFALIFLPLALKFFVRTLRDLNQQPTRSPLKNFAFSALFLSLSVSAHEQFFLSAALIAIYLSATFMFCCFRRYGQTSHFVRISLTNILLFAVVLVVVNIPLLLSLDNIGKAPLATYFMGRFNDFLANVKYTYTDVNLVTLLRLGGDSGVGLGKSSWFDTNAYTNLFGYALFIAFVISVFLLVFRKERSLPDKPFFYMNIAMFLNAILLMALVKSLPNDRALSANLFSFVLQTWESPTKLRAILLVSGLTTAIVAFRRLEDYGQTRRRTILKGSMIALLISSTIVYNSPWLVNYAGYTPLQQISENLKWGNLFDERYSGLATFLGEDYADERGLIVPYTHKAELYAPPNFRLFQLVSSVNEQMIRLTQGHSVPWSKMLGLLSAKYLAITEDYEPDEILMFPKPFDNGVTNTLGEIRNDNSLKFLEAFDNYEIFENDNALPLLYATKRFVFYDDFSTLKYAIQLQDFMDLPVFLGSGGKINNFDIPEFVSENMYEVNALSLSSNSSKSSLTLLVTNGRNSREIILDKVATVDDVDLFSTISSLSPGDTVKVPDSEMWNESRQIDELVLNSTSLPMGDYGSFMLNFTVNVLEKGEYTFLAPRVLVRIGVSGSKEYIVVLHDNGVVELAVLDRKVLTPNLLTHYTGHNLQSADHSIDVTVTRIFDEIHVYINGNWAISFPTEATISTVSLSSEHSTSRFSDIRIETWNVLRLYATRQVLAQPVSFLKQNDPSEPSLVISNGGPECAVVSQYLYTELNYIENQNDSHEMRANVFFKGWILNAGNSSSQEMPITISIRNSQISTGSAIFSIFFVYTLLILGAVRIPRTLLASLYRKLARLKQTIWRRTTKSDF